ncbi:SRPBCC family protein [Agromyces sp. SYSU T0242]|uniref:SRPBCC family protein n=1 Tax=Agromyces litoreus TaxID=3158561 RepID=UPI00339AEB55
MQFENLVTIRRPRPDVFAYLADFGNIPRWNHAIRETHLLTELPVRVGSRFRQVRTLPSVSEEEFEVTEFDPDRRIAVEGVIAGFRGRATYVLDGEGDTTTLTNAAELAASGAMGFMVSLAAPRVRAAVAENLGVLKDLLERA